ncbi:MAG: hypothetical protein AAGE65_08220 [Planctomycetota bacterium]
MNRTEAWRSPDGQRWQSIGTAGEHTAARPVLDAAGFHPDPPAPNHGAPPDAILLLNGTADPPAYAADRFLKALAWLHARTPAHVPVRHPAVLAANLAPRFADLYAVTGYPGTGNVVLTRVLGKIEEHRAAQPAPDDHPAWQQAQRYAQHHAKLMHAAAQGLLAVAAAATHHAVEEFVLAPGHLGQCSVRATLRSLTASRRDEAPPTVFLLNHLPHAGFLNRPYGAHSRWTDEAASFFPAFGYRRVYLAVRDPLAVLCSNAAKTVRPLEHALHDPDWFRPIAGQIADYHADAQNHRHAHRVVRYEDLTQQPRSTIQRLGRDAGVELTDAQADAIWQQVGFKSLTPAGDEHLFNPTADKRPHFRPVHARWMAEAKLDAAFADHGYAVPQAHDFPDQPLEPPQSQIDKRPSALYGRIDPRTMHAARDADLQLWLRSSEPALPDAFLDAFKSTWRVRLLETLGPRFGQLQLPDAQRVG